MKQNLVKKKEDDKGALHVFDEAQAEIFMLMNADSYSRFCRSEHYRNYRSGVVPSSSNTQLHLMPIDLPEVMEEDYVV